MLYCEINSLTHCIVTDISTLHSVVLPLYSVQCQYSGSGNHGWCTVQWPVAHQDQSLLADITQCRHRGHQGMTGRWGEPTSYPVTVHLLPSVSDTQVTSNPQVASCDIATDGSQRHSVNLFSLFSPSLNPVTKSQVTLS